MKAKSFKIINLLMNYNFLYSTNFKNEKNHGYKLSTNKKIILIIFYPVIKVIVTFEKWLK